MSKKNGAKEGAKHKNVSYLQRNIQEYQGRYSRKKDGKGTKLTIYGRHLIQTLKIKKKNNLVLLLDGSTSPPANLAEVCPLCEPAGLAEQNKTVYYPAAPDPTNSIANPINNIGKMHEHVFF